ncbi:MAG: endonuclease/exonuclease/phosphatase family protein [Bdellovibrionaceae bacterium]|nr:endonuclease/exonuclease/phosphatase family protein [Pseudobdellovibrionaceae bacterium]
MILNLRILFTFSLLLLLTACSTAGKKFQQEPEAISVMAYNMENLFDTQHDDGTEDHTYLPSSQKTSESHKRICNNIRHGKYRDECLNMDWNENVLNRKMQRLSDVVLQVNKGKGPDILIVEEVENLRVLKMLNEKFLKAANYQTVVLIEGFDKRGIDVGLLSRLPQYKEAQLHKIPYKGKNDEDQEWMDRSRGILQVNLLLPDKTKLSVFGIHFPSGSNPTYWRQQSAAYLNQLMKTLPSDVLAVAGGDFNINASEDSSHKLYQKDLGEDWMVSHLIGCYRCRGTNYYHTKREWSFLDALLFHKNLDPKNGSSNWVVDPGSVGIPNYSVYQKNRFMSPARFEENSPVGVSDHWPIYGVIKPRSSVSLKK